MKFCSNRPSGGSGGGAGAGRQLHRTRARLLRSNAALRATAGTRGAAGVIIGASSSGGSGSGSSSRPLVVPYVPEELVSQAQVVLQGKSRNLIIRELQVCFKSLMKNRFSSFVYSWVLTLFAFAPFSAPIWM